MLRAVVDVSKETYRTSGNDVSALGGRKIHGGEVKLLLEDEQSDHGKEIKSTGVTMY